MTLAHDDGPEREDDDMIAAEYVLGVLPADERQAAALRIRADAGFARLVQAWEMRLAPLASGYDDIQPPAFAKDAIDRRLFSAATAPTGQPRASLWTSLALWRGLAAAVAAVLAIYIMVPYVWQSVEPPQMGLIASLAANDSDVKYLAVYDADRHEVRLSHVSGERASGKDFELWMIEGKNAPVSMGVIPTGSTTRLTVKPDVQRKLAQGTVLAVSVEPSGGSPTGQPTGPVVAAGDLKDI